MYKYKNLFTFHARSRKVINSKEKNKILFTHLISFSSTDYT